MRHMGHIGSIGHIGIGNRTTGPIGAACDVVIS
jgi:hypothetical protein